MEHDSRTDYQDARELVNGVQVRLISDSERRLWAQLMREYHYLGFQGLVGESLRYVAVYKEQWVALLGWAAPALSCKPRDQWIGWPAALKWHRLPLVANNFRFLILPGMRVHNLASRILALNINRLSQDWHNAYGHPIWLVETFVDPRFFRGTCYKAAGWICLGNTRGFARHAGRYTHHGCPKLVFVRTLRPDASQRLSDPYLSIQLNSEPKPMKLSIRNAELLLEALRTIPDPRMARGMRHKKLSILAIAVCALVCGAHGFAAIAQWAQACSQDMLKRLLCRRDKKTGRYVPPSEPTIRRFIQTVDAEAVDLGLMGWPEAIGPSDSAIAVDGKTLKGARSPNGRQTHILTAFLHQGATVVAQKAVPEHTNEITVLKSLLDPLPIEGRVVTADALHTQQTTARYLVEEKKADYVFTVKDNQPTLKSHIEDLDNESFSPCGDNGQQGPRTH
jgi:Domain of unknown function (DUF4338)/DDE_Tnp_1-associated/Transposase DDE domain